MLSLLATKSLSETYKKTKLYNFEHSLKMEGMLVQGAGLVTHTVYSDGHFVLTLHHDNLNFFLLKLVKEFFVSPKDTELNQR